MNPDHVCVSHAGLRFCAGTGKLTNASSDRVAPVLIVTEVVTRKSAVEPKITLLRTTSSIHDEERMQINDSNHREI